MNPCTYGYLIFDREGKNIQWDILQYVLLGKLDSYMQKNEIRTLSKTLHTKINSKWIKELNVRPETIKLLEENIGSTLYDINHSKILYDQPPRVMEIKTNINKWDLIKLKSFCTGKETINKVKRQPPEREKIMANDTTDKYTSSSFNSIPEKQPNQKVGKRPKQTFFPRRHTDGQ